MDPICLSDTMRKALCLMSGRGMALCNEDMIACIETEGCVSPSPSRITLHYGACPCSSRSRREGGRVYPLHSNSGL